MSSKKSKDEPEQDPYDVLGVKFGDSDAAISKAYKKLALKLHPDKQIKKSPVEAEEVAKRLQLVFEARAFLLEPENQEKRRKYDAKRESIQRRREAEKIRQEAMSGKRSRQLDELKRAEEEAMRDKKKSRKNKSSKSRSKAEDELIEKLRGESKKLREEAARKREEEAVASARHRARNDKQDQKQRERLLQNRQIRLKWSRKKMETSPSEHSLATLLSKFGTVEEVEMIGSKGNLALITFEVPSSCRPCVDFYKSHDAMRAHFVGKRKEEEESKEAAAEQQEQEQEILRSRGESKRWDAESLEERKLRQAEEREKLLREMEAEEAGESQARSKEAEKGSTNVTSRCVSVSLPSKYKNLPPMESLRKAEEDILGKLLTGEALARLQDLHA